MTKQELETKVAMTEIRDSEQSQIDVQAQQSHVIFRLNQQLYALSVDFVVQIISMVTIGPLPQVSEVVEGLINVRGESVVVVNLRRQLGLPEIAFDLNTPILLVRVNEHVVGLIVDEVVDVLEFSLDDAVQSSEILPDGLGEIAVLLGVIQEEIGTVLIINIDRLFINNDGVSINQVVSQISMIPESEVSDKTPDMKVAGVEKIPSTAPPPENGFEKVNELPIEIEDDSIEGPDHKKAIKSSGESKRKKKSKPKKKNSRSKKTKSKKPSNSKKSSKPKKSSNSNNKDRKA